MKVPGSTADRKYRRWLNKLFKDEMVIGVRFRKHDLESMVRLTSDIPNGNAYRKLPKHVKYSFTMT